MHKINPLLALIIVVSAALIQISAFGYISIYGIKPDLLLVIMVFFALSATRQEAIRAALVLGMIKDVASFSVFGSYSITFLLMAIFLNYHEGKFYREKAFTQIILLFASYLAMSLLIFGFNLLAYKTAFSYQTLLDVAIKGGAYTAFIAPITFFILSKLLRVRLAHKVPH